MDLVNQKGSGHNHVLVVEDEAEIRNLISLHLRREGYAVDEVMTGEEAQTKINNNRYDLLVLDWMLPGMSGMDLTRMVRGSSQYSKVPILFVTAKVSDDDIVSGLDAGADDYLTKPFDYKILLSRVRSLLRRHRWNKEVLSQVQPSQSPKTADKYTFGAIEIDEGAFGAYMDGEKLNLTRSEFKLLLCLLQNQGRVLTRNRLIEEIQGEGVSVVGRTVDTHVFGLRKKLGSHGDLIETVRGVGYRVGYSQ